jgi:hypothetical protein
VEIGACRASQQLANKSGTDQHIPFEGSYRDEEVRILIATKKKL